MGHRLFIHHKNTTISRLFWSMLVVVLLGFALVSCTGGSSRGTRAFPLVDEDLQARELVPAPDKSVVYFYHGSYSLLWKHDIDLDGAASKMQKNGYLVWETDPGEHTFQVTFHKMMTKHRFRSTIKTEGGLSYYYQLRFEKDPQASSTSYDAIDYHFQKVQEDTGRERIKTLSLMAWFQDGNVVFRRQLEDVETAVAATPEAPPAPEAEPRPEPEISSEPKPAEKEAPAESPLLVQGNNYALVIGISKYEHLETLPNAVDDAQAVAGALREYGFKVNTLFDGDATRERLLDSLEVFQRTLTPEDRFLLYYAGHSQFGADGQIVYWQPVEAKEDSMAQWIGVNAVTAALKQMPAVHALVVADSLYSGTFAQASQLDLRDATVRRRYLEDIAGKHARVIITSGASHPSVASSAGELSLFAGAFVDGLANFSTLGRRAFAAEELFQSSILAIVAGQSEQMPSFQAIRNSGHGGGDFLFLKE